MNAQDLAELDARIDAHNAKVEADQVEAYEVDQDMIDAINEAQGPIPVATRWSDAERYFQMLG